MKHFRTIALGTAQILILLGMCAPLASYAQETSGPVTRPAPVAPVPEGQPANGTPASQPASTPAPAAKPTNAPATQGAAPQQATQVDSAPVTSAFVPLNVIPGFIEAANSPNLPTFFNGLYKLCIGAAAVIAVIQIMRAGFEFMVNKGSVSGNEHAKSLIQNALIGLVLVLSPAIVFGIINPKILNLSLDVSQLQPGQLSQVKVPGQFAESDAMLWEHVGDRAADATRCTQSNGTITYRCVKKDVSTYRVVPASEQCATDENNYNVCTANANVPQTGDQCQMLYTEIASTTATSINKCNTANGYLAIPHGCCTGSPLNTICCGKPK
ncbi:MAG: hypothetical protein V4480_01680 [Patescibacteria group bacterium]